MLMIMLIATDIIHKPGTSSAELSWLWNDFVFVIQKL